MCSEGGDWESAGVDESDVGTCIARVGRGVCRPGTDATPGTLGAARALRAWVSALKTNRGKNTFLRKSEDKKIMMIVIIKVKIITKHDTCRDWIYRR